MAIGLSRIFGFDLMANFKFPFLSKNINDFWNRWHISLSSWFRDYLYIPLGGNRHGKRRAIINVFIVFLVSGFWHGANWTFILWGMIHGFVYLLYYISKDKDKANQSNFSLPDVIQMIITFCIISIAFVFFRSPSVMDSLGYLKGMVVSNGSGSFYISTSKHLLITGITLAGSMILIAYEFMASKRGLYEVRLRKVDLILLGLSICFLGAFKNHLDFIYFQF